MPTATDRPTIVEAAADPMLFRDFFGRKRDALESWSPWLSFFRCLYGLELDPAEDDLVREATGRDPRGLPRAGFKKALALVGRRGGKSRAAALIAAFEAAVADRTGRLAPGERGLVALCGPSKEQGGIALGYLRALFDGGLLAGEVEREDRGGFDLRNGTRIQVLAGDYRTVRGFSLLAAVVEEAAFFGAADDSKVRSDAELVRALEPGLATTGGRLIAITSPYARKGWTYSTHQRAWGNDNAVSLVWKAPSLVMNPRLDPGVVAQATAEDPAAARSEFGAEFRDDVETYITRETVLNCVVPGRRELLPRLDRHSYSAFCDISGGRADDAALAVGHREGERVVIDLVRRWKAPFSPAAVAAEMAAECKRFGVYSVGGDNYAANFNSSVFEAHGVGYDRSATPRADLYRELLPRLCSRLIELPDDAGLVAQIASLERRVRAGGRDVIDHPPGGKDDLANVVAGVCQRTAVEVECGAL